MTTNALTYEEKYEFLDTKSNIDDLKYWFENNEYEGEHFQEFVDHFYEYDEGYLMDYIITHIASKNDDEEFIDICKDLDIELEGKMKAIADFYETHSWTTDEVEPFVACTIRFNDDDEEKRVTIALKSIEELGFKEGDANDEEIFYYCDSIEEFFDLCDEDTTCEDFVVLIDEDVYYSDAI